MQVLVLAHPRRHKIVNPEIADRKNLLQVRGCYLAAWERENRRIADLVADRNVVLFDTGEFAQVMRAYIPDAMAAVREACATPLQVARDIGLELKKLEETDGVRNSLLLAVNASSRSGGVAMLIERGIRREALIYPAELEGIEVELSIASCCEKVRVLAMQAG